MNLIIHVLPATLHFFCRTRQGGNVCRAVRRSKLGKTVVTAPSGLLQLAGPEEWAPSASKGGLSMSKPGLIDRMRYVKRVHVYQFSAPASESEIK